MSGGYFDYKQYQIQYIIDDIEHLINTNNRKCTDECEKEYAESSWRSFHTDCKAGYNYPNDIIEEFKKAVKYLKTAQIYAQRIDWLVSGDDGIDTFRDRLTNDLLELK